MTATHAAVVAVAGIVAGAVNAIAGGGTLVTFPALLGVGLSALSANVTSSVGLLSGYLGGSVAYRRELTGQSGRARALTAVSLVGGAAGAVVLLVTPAATFRNVVPFLILASCLLLGIQPWLAGVVARRSGEPAGDGELGYGVHAGVAVSAVYGSYFGAGLGVLLLAVLGVLVRDDLQRLNALKGLLSLLINVVGVLIFVFSGKVAWADAGILAVAAYLGGTAGVSVARRLAVAAYLGGTAGVSVARRLAPQVLRTSVIVLGVAVAAYLIAR